MPSRTPINCTRYPLKSGDAGIARTVRYMYALVAGREGAANPAIRTKALEITRNVRSHDRAGEVRAIYEFVKNNIKFRGEYKETLQSPVITLQLAAGDCDDHSTLIAALLQSIGHKTRFKTIATGGPEFSHVYAEVFNRGTGQWIPLDTTVPGASVGWAVPNPTRVQAWEKPAGMAGLGEAREIPYTQPGTVTVGPRTANAIAIIDQFQPILQAIGSRIAYGQKYGAGLDLNLNTGRTLNFPNGVPTVEQTYLGAPISTWVIAAMFVVGTYALARK